MTAEAYTTDPQLNEFIRGYIAAMLWAENDESDDSGGNPFDDNYDADDIAPEAFATIVADCTKFFTENREDLREGPAHFREGEGTIYDWHGHDFWLTRRHHGVGFWDRDYDDDTKGDRLTVAAQKFSDCNPYLGDDGKIWI